MQWNGKKSKKFLPELYAFMIKSEDKRQEAHEGWLQEQNAITRQSYASEKPFFEYLQQAIRGNKRAKNCKTFFLFFCPSLVPKQAKLLLLHRHNSERGKNSFSHKQFNLHSITPRHQRKRRQLQRAAHSVRSQLRKSIQLGWVGMFSHVDVDLWEVRIVIVKCWNPNVAQHFTSSHQIRHSKCDQTSESTLKPNYARASTQKPRDTEIKSLFSISTAELKLCEVEDINQIGIN